MASAQSRRLLLRHLLSAVLLLAPVAAVLATPSVGHAAPDQRGPVERVVQGNVTDQSGKAISGAVVYLKDTRTMGIKSYIAAADGSYRFGQLSSSTDYQLWAEAAGKKSPTKTISSFDSSNLFVINLKINTAK